MSATELAESIVGRFLMIVRYRHRLGHRLSKEYQISGKQAVVLRYLVRDGAQTVSAISRYLYVSDGTTSSLLDRMEHAGHVTRRRGTIDCRKVYIEPTPMGRELVQSVPMGVTSRLRSYLPDLAIEELESIDKALGRLFEIAQVEESGEAGAV